MNSPLIALQGVHKAYGKHAVIRGLDLTVPANSIYAFLGNNGSGKSTTIRLITGLMQADRGSIEVLGRDIRTQRRAILAQIGAIVDAPCFYPNLTASEFLSIGCRIKHLATNEAARVLELTGLREASGRRIADFSLGMRQRLAIAHALLGAPPLLILDEPTNGLDPQGIRDMRQLIRELPAQTGATVFVSSHNLDEVEKIATHVAVLQDGVAVHQGPMAALMDAQTGAVRLTVDDAARAAQLLGAAGYDTDLDGASELAVRRVALQDADRVHALLISAGVKLYQSVHGRPTLEQWFLEASDAQRETSDA
ncbi:MAG TPA: ATP-binding cassette domain-containing protein [Burkholderiaceae bacterium]